MLAAALLLVPGSLVGLVLGHPAGVADQANLAWLATSIAALGGALGAALESSESVREAAYTYQPDTQIDAVAPPAGTSCPVSSRWTCDDVLARRGDRERLYRRSGR